MVKYNREANFAIMQKWIYENHMVLNPGYGSNVITC